VVGDSGIAASGSDFTLAGATNGNHNGVTSTVGQAALLQGGDGTLAGASFSQTVTLPSGNWFLLMASVVILALLQRAFSNSRNLALQ
jgi:hypothetical protein